MFHFFAKNAEYPYIVWKESGEGSEVAADNQKLYDFLMGLWNGPSIGQANSEVEHYSKSTQEHIQILQHIRNGNPQEARQIMEIHIERSMNNILKSFHHAYFD